MLFNGKRITRRESYCYLQQRRRTLPPAILQPIRQSARPHARSALRASLIVHTLRRCAKVFKEQTPYKHRLRSKIIRQFTVLVVLTRWSASYQMRRLCSRCHYGYLHADDLQALFYCHHRPYVSPSVRRSVRPFVRPSVRPSVRPFVVGPHVSRSLRQPIRSFVPPPVRPPFVRPSFVRPSARPFIGSGLHSSSDDAPCCKNAPSQCHVRGLTITKCP